MAACGCVRLRASTSGARTGARWCPQGVGRRELIFGVICSVCAHTSSCGHLRHAPTHCRGLCSHSSAPHNGDGKDQRPMPLRLGRKVSVRWGGGSRGKLRFFRILPVRSKFQPTRRANLNLSEPTAATLRAHRALMAAPAPSRELDGSVPQGRLGVSRDGHKGVALM